MSLQSIFQGIGGAISGIEQGIGGVSTVGFPGTYPGTYTGAPAPAGGGGFVLAGNSSGLSGSGSLSMMEIVVLLAIIALVVWLIVRR